MTVLQKNAPKQSDNEKNKMVEKLADVLVEVYKARREANFVYSRENKPEDIGFGVILVIQ